MIFTKLDIPEIILCEPKVYEDSRGYFMESFLRDDFDKFVGFSINFCQENESNTTLGVFRGLHYQIHPFAQSKLVRVIRGSVIDFVVDIRKNSPTFKQYLTVKLSDKNKKQLFIPRGFAHGFLSLENNTIFSYKVDNKYNKDCDRGINVNDSELKINLDQFLPNQKVKFSEKDQLLPTFKEQFELFSFEDNLYG